MRRAACFLILGLTGCVGLLGDDDAGSSGSTEPGAQTADVAWAPIRRMTPLQFENSVRDLVGDPALTLDLDEDTGEAFSRLAAEKLNLAVEHVVSRRDQWQNEVFPCDTTGPEDLACVDLFIEQFGLRAFRRPLDAEESAWLRGVYDVARADLEFEDAMHVVFSVILQSPQFFYFPEVGRDPAPGDDVADGVRPLTSYERATRLSFFLLDSVPDAELLEAAEAGLLDTPDGVRAEAERLLALPRARALFRGFVTDMLGLDGDAQHTSLEDALRDPALFPLDSPSLRQAMRGEVDALVDRVVVEERGSFGELLTTRQALVDDDLAALYGVSASADGWVTLPEERAGLLTRASFLTVYSRGDVKSPIRRGAYVVEKLLCMELGAPPPNANDVPITGGSVDENGEIVRRTIRQDAELKTSGDGCTGCHVLINPPGFAFENFDALGQYVTVETGSDDDGDYSLPIDASGALPDPSGSVEVTGAAELSAALAASPAVHACVADRWFQIAARRTPAAADARSLERIEAALLEERPFVDVALETALSDAFLFLREESAQ